jgi:hypothetical protein
MNGMLLQPSRHPHLRSRLLHPDRRWQVENARWRLVEDGRRCAYRAHIVASQPVLRSVMLHCPSPAAQHSSLI